MGRPRKYSTNAERQYAYDERKRQERRQAEIEQEVQSQLHAKRIKREYATAYELIRDGAEKSLERFATIEDQQAVDKAASRLLKELKRIADHPERLALDEYNQPNLFTLCHL